MQGATEQANAGHCRQREPEGMHALGSVVVGSSTELPVRGCSSAPARTAAPSSPLEAWRELRRAATRTSLAKPCAPPASGSLAATRSWAAAACTAPPALAPPTLSLLEPRRRGRAAAGRAAAPAPPPRARPCCSWCSCCRCCCCWSSLSCRGAASRRTACSARATTPASCPQPRTKCPSGSGIPPHLPRTTRPAATHGAWQAGAAGLSRAVRGMQGQRAWAELYGWMHAGAAERGALHCADLASTWG